MIFLISISNCYAQSTFFTGGNICKDTEWNLVFNDEFANDSLDKSKWLTYFPDAPDGSDQCEFCRTHGNEGQIFTDTNFSISGGTIKLIARKQTATWFTATREHTSGLITSKFRFMYGRFEARCKLALGKGLFSAFWLFGGNGSGIGTEIDVYEIPGGRPNHHAMGVIKWHETEFFARKDCAVDGNILEDGFHTYSVEWDPFLTRFYLDEIEVFVISRFYTLSGTQVNWCCVEPSVYNILPAYPEVAHNYVGITLSLGVGADEDAPNEDTIFPNQLEIDYIRVYQRDTIENENYRCEVFLYPNPASSYIKVKKSNMTFLRLENIMGQIIYSKSLDSDETQIDLDNLEQGFYFIEVQSKEGTFANKFIKY